MESCLGRCNAELHIEEFAAELLLPPTLAQRAGIDGTEADRLDQLGHTYLCVSIVAGDEDRAPPGAGCITSQGGEIAKVDGVECLDNARTRQVPSDDLFAAAGELAARASEPRDDVRGTATWKRQVVRTFTRRALAAAAAQAQEQ